MNEREMLLKSFKNYYMLRIILFGLILLVSGCQGRPKSNPPIHLNPNMDFQPKYEPQESSEFFMDGKAMQTPVEGTVARGELFEDISFWKGLDSATGDTLKESPLPPTMNSLLRGQERYNIYCAVCHDQTGAGKGIVVQRGYLPPPSFHIDRLRNVPDGHIFNVITNGIRNMPGYAQQVSVEDRWHIVNYLRALQRSQNADMEDIPEDKRDEIVAK